MALLTKVKTRLALQSRRKVVGHLEGRHTSMHAGRSLDFADLRGYIAGDDVADIDWKASARHGELLVKRYVADRKHTVALVVDTGQEMAAAASWREPEGDLKRDLAVTVAGVLGWLAVNHGDYVGLVCATDEGPTMMRPSTREVELERMLDLIQRSCRTDSPPQHTRRLLEYATTMTRRRAIMVLVTGDLELSEGIEEALRRLVVQHELIVITLADVDPTVPGRAGHAVVDVATGRRLPRFATVDPALATAIAEADAERIDHRRSTLARLGVTQLQLSELERVVPELLGLVEGMRRAR